jgi:hypothetical protein
MGSVARHYGPSLGIVSRSATPERRPSVKRRAYPAGTTHRLRAPRFCCDGLVPRLLGDRGGGIIGAWQISRPAP